MWDLTFCLFHQWKPPSRYQLTLTVNKNFKCLPKLTKALFNENFIYVVIFQICSQLYKNTVADCNVCFVRYQYAVVAFEEVLRVESIE